MRIRFIIISLITIALMVMGGLYLANWIWYLLILAVPVFLIGIYDMVQKKHSILRIYPVMGHFRYVADWMRPKIYQYFVESDYEGRPFPRTFRSTIYSRAKDDMDTSPFGTLSNVYAEGYEWMNHSLNPIDPEDVGWNKRVLIGGPECRQPYSASILNVSAMSFGSLSKNAIMALNGGAAIGNFAHNTGEGGISPYHNQFGGDLIFQIGTGYFGCRTPDGNFDPNKFAERTAADNVKMIELKLSQGAKPGHGGILPGKKVTPEIAEIRNIEPYKDVISPPYHKAFSNPVGLLSFIQELRTLSGGKPVGFKLCLGHQYQFVSICKAMIETGIKPDFIAIDGGEGGTGAAPLEFSNSVGFPFREALAFAYDALVGFDLKRDIKLIGAGKIATGFHIYRAIALGADLCYSARAMMMALGCIQALQCNKNTCPVGVTSQDPSRVQGLVVEDKKNRVANYHKETVESFVELLAASGMTDPDLIGRHHICRRIVMNQTQRYDEIYPYISKGCLLNESNVPKEWQVNWQMGNPKVF